MNLRQRIILTVVTYPFIIYAIAYLSVWFSPYWYDNSPIPQYIPWSERWEWALLVSCLYLIWGFPLLLITIILTIYLT
jgi:hypothetical protein